MKKVLVICGILYILCACGNVPPIEEQPYKTYEITLPNYTTEIVEAKKCSATYKSKIATNTPVYSINCYNDSYGVDKVYIGLGISIKEIEKR